MNNAISAPMGPLVDATPRIWFVTNSSTTVPKRLTSFDISGITRTGGVATATTSAVHDMQVGDLVVISGCVETGYNGTWAIETVPSTTTFTYSVPDSTVTPATGTIVSYAILWCGWLTLYGRKTNLETDSTDIVRVSPSSVNGRQVTPVGAGGETNWPVRTGAKLGLHNLYFRPVVVNEGLGLSFH